MKFALLLFMLIFSRSVQCQVTTFLDVPYHTVDGDDQNLLSIDVYEPNVEGPKPIVIYVHGGAWVSGDKSVFGEKMKLFTDMGYIFISVNYRLSPFPYELDNPDRIKYPQHPDDVARAVSFVLDNAIDNDGDLNRVAIMGHSAGAQIVSLIMTDESFLESYGHSPSEIKCLCSLDTGGYDINLWLANAVDSTVDLYTNAFSADSIVLRDASPALNTDDSDELPLTLLVHQNTLKRDYINTLFADSLSKYGAEVMTISTDYDHGEINQKIGDFQDEASTLYTEEIASWFESCLTTSVSTSEIESTIIHFFPNPASDIVYISGIANYQIMDLNGQVLFSGYGRSIDVSMVVPGLYLLSITSKESKLRQLLWIK